MRFPLFFVLLFSACVTPVVAKKEVAAAPPQVVACPAGPVPFTETGDLRGATVEKVCLVGASEESSLALHALVAPREGSPLESSAVRSDLEAMFERGLVRDVVAVAQPLASKGVMLIYLVTEYELIATVDFTGLSVVKLEELTRLAPSGVRASPFGLKRVAAAVKALYAERGHSRAKVEVNVKRLGGGKAGLTLEIEEGPAVRVTSISFEGSKQLSDFELRKGGPVFDRRALPARARRA